MTTSVQKPQRDHREYRYFELPGNKLRCFVVSDAQTDKAAACLDVNVGSFFDGAQHQGLAHFLEHMLFLGTQKYPDEAEYNNFLAKHGGWSNAYTSETDTVYYFSVAAGSLAGALDRFAQFFVAPLFTESATTREKEAVNSEHMKNLQEDAWREHQLLKTLVFPPGHVAHHFSTGNLQTLASVPRDVLLDFHSKYYSANVMTLAVVGKESLDELEQLVKQLFKDVANSDVHVPKSQELVEAFSTPAGAAADAAASLVKGKVVTVVPVKEATDKVQIEFYIPDQAPLWRSKPGRFLAHVLGHEAEGSVLASLKRRGLATDLSAGVVYEGAGLSVFRVEVHLAANNAAGTSDPEVAMRETVQTVLDAVLSGAEVARKAGGRDDAEMLQMDEINFRFKNVNDSVSLAQTLATNMQHAECDMAEVLRAGEVVTQYDAEIIDSYLAMIHENNVTVKLVAKKYRGSGTDTEGLAAGLWQTEPWYGVQFAISDLHSWYQRRADPLVAPIAKNVFVPEATAAAPAPAAAPAAAAATAEEEAARAARLWEAPTFSVRAKQASVFYAPDEGRFDLPKAAIGLALYPVASAAAAAAAVVDRALRAAVGEVVAQAVAEALNEKVGYQASMAGLKFSVRSAMQEGSVAFMLNFSGYAEKLDRLVECVVGEFARGVESEQVLSTVVDRLMRNLQNQRFRKSYEEAVEQNNAFMLSDFVSLDERIAAMTQLQEKLKKGELGAFVANFSRENFSAFAVEMLVAGDLSQDRMQQMLDQTVLGKLQVVRPAEIPLPAVMDLQATLTQTGRATAVLSRAVRNPEEVNSAVVTTVPLGRVAVAARETSEAELRTSALALVLNQAVSQWFFDELRTKQQLGYIVNAQNGIVGGQAVLKFVVQSSEKPASDLRARVDKFIDQFVVPSVESLTHDEVAKYKAAVQKTLTEKPKNLSERFGMHWGEIVSRRFHFQRRLEIARVVDTLTKQDLLEFAIEKLTKSVRLHSLVRGAKDEEPSDAAETLSADECKTVREGHAVWIPNNQAQL